MSARISKFATWHPSSEVKIGTPEYYTRQTYTRGARCWNGPERSVTVRFLVHLAVMHSLELISMLKLYTADIVMRN